MKSIVRKLFAVVFAVCLALAFTGCSSGGGSSTAASSSSASPAASASSSSTAASASASASASSAAASAGSLADGTYSIAVTLEGGTGKATVESPATLTVSGSQMVATIVWSSKNYDLMVVDGTQYKPVSSSGNSTFEIPVSALDADLPVQAETTAMSEPHMIDYTLRFDSSTLK